MAIPKIIHYCWFGGRENQPKIVRDCIASWSKLDDYQICEWNESNFDPGPDTYFEQMVAARRFAFVSDTVRLVSLYRMGGIYLDCDIEVMKKFPESMLQHQAFLSFMFNCTLGAAVLGAEPKSPLIGKLMEHYRNLEDLTSPSNNIFTRFFLKEFPEFRLNNKFQVLKGDVAIYPKEYFECPTYNPNMGYTVDHALGSWFRKEKSIRSYLRAGAKRLVGNVIYTKLSKYKGMKVSPFYQTYLEHRALDSQNKKQQK